MVEPPFAAPSEVASERDALLATKLHVPRPRPDLVPRPRLAERLDEGLARGLMLVCAPAGYGKTVLLADWARRDQPPVAWLSLDVGDNDPARFWRHAVAALDQGRPGLAERVGPLLGPPAPASYEGLVTALINELAAGPDAGQALLVLDDYHLIDSEAVHSSLGFLLEHRPPGLHLVLASRSDPPLALARLRARDAAGRAARRGAAVHRGRGGGAAAAGGGRIRRGPAGNGGDGAGRPHRGVGRRAAAGGLVAARTAPMSPGSSPRSPAATATCWTSWPRRCSSSRVSRCARSCWRPRCWSGCRGSCVTRSPAGLAARRCWSRWSERGCSWCRWMRCAAGGVTTTCSPTCSAPACRRNSPAGSRDCTGTRRPGMTDHEMADDTMRHAVAAGEMAWAARLIEQHFDELFYLRGEGVTVQRWLAALPGDLVRTRPRLLLAQAILASHSGRMETVEPLLDAAEQAYAGAAGEPLEPTVGRAGSMLVNVPALIAIRRGFLAQLRGDAEDTAAFASRALAESERGRVAAELYRPEIPGRGRVAPWPARGS